MRCTAAYLIWNLGLVGPVMQITNATFSATWKEIKSSLEDKGIQVDSILDGSLFWDRIQGINSGIAPHDDVELKELKKTHKEPVVEPHTS